MPIRVHYRKDQVITWLTHRFPSTDWNALLEDCPGIIWRHRWNDLADRYGLPYSKGHLQNLDSRGEGPGSL